MSMDYIRRTYGPGYRRGARVEYFGVTPSKKGTVLGSDGYRLRVRLDGETHTRKFHPTWELHLTGEVV